MLKKIVIVFTMLILIVGCGKKKDEEKRYKVSIAEDGDSSGYINVNGNVEANDTKKVFVDKKLKVKEVFVQEGDYIERGQLLMTFDETERNKIKREIEKENLTLTKLKRDYHVESELSKIGGSPANTVKDLKEQIRASELVIEGLKEDLSKTAERVVSPVSGTITKLVAQENYSVNTDEPLLELADLSDIKIILEVPEYNVKDLKLGQKLIIKPEVFEKKKSYNGVITKISRVSKVSDETGENVLEVEVKPQEVIPHLVPGFKVSATIYVGEKKTGIRIPKSAVLYGDKKYYVFVLSGGNVVKKQYIKFTDEKGEFIKIDSGLKVGEKYVVNPTEDLKDGDEIKVGRRNDKNKKAK